MEIMNQLGKAALELLITFVIGAALAAVAFGLTGGRLLP